MVSRAVNWTLRRQKEKERKKEREEKKKKKKKKIKNLAAREQDGEAVF